MKKITTALLLVLSINSYSQITGGATGALPNGGATGYIPRFNGATNIISSNIYQAGVNVGINVTANPTVPLQVQANNSAGYGILINQTGGGQAGINLWNTNTTNPGRNWGIWSTGPGNTGGAGNFIIQDVTAGQSRFFVSGTTGRIGIGTTAPTQQLDVNGNANISSDVYSGGNIEVISPTAGPVGRLFAGKGKSIMGAGILNSYDNQGGVGLWVESNYPIGQPYNGVFASNHNDTKGLAVVDLTTSQALYGINKKHTFLVFGDGRTHINAGSTNLVEALTIGRESTPNLLDKNTVIYNNGAAHFSNCIQIGFPNGTLPSVNECLYIKAGTKTGMISEVNHTTPGGYNVQLKVKHDQTKSLAVENVAGSPKEAFVVWGNGKIQIAPTTPVQEAFVVIDQSNNFYNFRIMADGKTYIGKEKVASRPNSMLTVDGEIDCKSLYVLKPITWSDNVFDDSYKLLSLNSVEKYIANNKHLPGFQAKKKF
ncbi:MAG: hypothetical protein IPJ60_07560 [Sphingobacteriaceae bacterium]|nr:hypothetical protein [Sphingobacteriaceae bacterium]